jgi:hypothetical protein
MKASDLPEQSIQIGKFQHVRERIERGELVLNAIGAVLEGRCSGRIARNDITISTTLALLSRMSISANFSFR